MTIPTPSSSLKKDNFKKEEETMIPSSSSSTDNNNDDNNNMEEEEEGLYGFQIHQLKKKCSFQPTSTKKTKKKQSKSKWKKQRSIQIVINSATADTTTTNNKNSNVDSNNSLIHSSSNDTTITTNNNNNNSMKRRRRSRTIPYRFHDHPWGSENHTMSIEQSILSQQQEQQQYQEEEEDPLEFYSQTHEEQDTAYIQFKREKEQVQYDKCLKELQVESEQSNIVMEQTLEKKWKDQTETFQRQCEKLRSDMKTKQEYQIEQLLARHDRLIKTENANFIKGREWLISSHAKEYEKSIANSIPMQDILGETKDIIINKLKLKQEKELRSFEEKKSKALTKYGQEIQQKMKDLKEHHIKRKEELESTLKNLKVKFTQQIITQQRKDYQIHYKQRMERKRKEIQSRFQFLNFHENNNNNSDIIPSDRNGTIDKDSKKNDPNKNKVEKKKQFFSPSDPKKDWSHSGDAVVRQKRRKTVMSSTQQHLSIELHNEGIIILHRGDTDPNKNKNTKNNKTTTPSSSLAMTKGKTFEATPLSLFGRNEDFIPWGVQATKILLSVVCGEVPNGYGCDFVEISRNSSLPGGQMKCLITDMRTSHETAMYQRIMALKKIEVSKAAPRTKELEKKILDSKPELMEKQAEAKKAAAEKTKITLVAKHEVEKADKVRKGLEDIKRKAAKYYNPGT